MLLLESLSSLEKVTLYSVSDLVFPSFLVERECAVICMEPRLLESELGHAIEPSLDPISLSVLFLNLPSHCASR